jgi:DNA-directed RNA polymerase specialized sigma24 family protein
MEDNSEHLSPQRGNMGSRFVIIPFDYERLAEPDRGATVPICIQSMDRQGNAIAPVWFEQGVAPIHNELINLASYQLGDAWRASELTEICVHKLWRHHGAEAGTTPWRRVWRQAFWEAKDMAAGDWRARRYRLIYRTLEELDREFPDKTVDPTDYRQLYEDRVLVEQIENDLRVEGLDGMVCILELLMRGDTWVEIGEPEKRRFYRMRRKKFTASGTFAQGTKTC